MIRAGEDARPLIAVSICGYLSAPLSTSLAVLGARAWRSSLRDTAEALLRLGGHSDKECDTSPLVNHRQCVQTVW